MPEETKKPIDRWLGCFGAAVGIVYFLLPKSPLVILISLMLIFCLLIHPLWNFWWIEKTRCRQIIAVSFFVALLLILGKIAWPNDLSIEPPKTDKTLTVPSIISPEKMSKPKQAVRQTEKKEQPRPEQKSEQTPKEPIPTLPASQIVMQVQSTGDLKQRTLIMSDEIMRDLYNHGWVQSPILGQNKNKIGHYMSQMPKTTEERYKWMKSQSSYLNFRFADKLIDIRNEFFQLHFRDEQLDRILKIPERMKYADTSNRFIMQYDISPLDMEEVAERLHILAEKIPY